MNITIISCRLQKENSVKKNPHRAPQKQLQKIMYKFINFFW